MFDDYILVEKGHIVKRPSAQIKSPYVCDVVLEAHEEEEDEDEDKVAMTLGHTPSLGCNGLVDTGADVYLTRKDNTKKTSGKCTHTVKFGICDETIIGVEPAMAEKIAEAVLEEGRLTSLQSKTLSKQVSYEDCRFDFAGVTTSNEAFICEVKNVSIAVYENIRPSLLKKRDYSQRDPNSKIAIFPSGFVPAGKTHSPRAVKQLKLLTRIKKERPEVRCVVMYVIQRDDIACFQLSAGDAIYQETVEAAKAAGVEFIAINTRYELFDDPETTGKMTVKCLFDKEVEME